MPCAIEKVNGIASAHSTAGAASVRSSQSTSASARAHQDGDIDQGRRGGIGRHGAGQRRQEQRQQEQQRDDDRGQPGAPAHRGAGRALDVGRGRRGAEQGCRRRSAVESASKARFSRGSLPSASSRPARWETPISVPVASNSSTRKKVSTTRSAEPALKRAGEVELQKGRRQRRRHREHAVEGTLAERDRKPRSRRACR
jgi:hypothetical protein